MSQAKWVDKFDYDEVCRVLMQNDNPICSVALCSIGFDIAEGGEDIYIRRSF